MSALGHNGAVHATSLRLREHASLHLRRIVRGCRSPSAVVTTTRWAHGEAFPSRAGKRHARSCGEASTLSMVPTSGAAEAFSWVIALTSAWIV